MVVYIDPEREEKLKFIRAKSGHWDVALALGWLIDAAWDKAKRLDRELKAQREEIEEKLAVENERDRLREEREGGEG